MDEKDLQFILSNIDGEDPELLLMMVGPDLGARVYDILSFISGEEDIEFDPPLTKEEVADAIRTANEIMVRKLHDTLDAYLE